MNHSDEEEAPLEGIAGLPREIRPRSDLWPGIAARIDPSPVIAKSAKRSFPIWALAASVLVAVCAGVFLARPWVGAPNGMETGGLADVRPEEESDQYTASKTPLPLPDARSAGEAEYVAAFREFLAMYPTTNPGSILPEHWVRETSGILSQAEIELTVALEQSPDDPLLQQRMAALRAHQLEWLKRMAAVERNSRRLSI